MAKAFCLITAIGATHIATDQALFIFNCADHIVGTLHLKL